MCVRFSVVSAPTLRRTVVLLISDERSRTVCSVVLRHEGMRVLEATSIDELIVLAGEQPVDLVLADVEPEGQAAFERELVEGLPGLACLFVHERMLPEIVTNEVRVSVRSNRHRHRPTN
jgi:hypothetical protein